MQVFKFLSIQLFNYSTIQESFREWKVKVYLSFGHIESKNFFYKSCSIWCVIWRYSIKSESYAAILSLFKLWIKSKKKFTKVTFDIFYLWFVICDLQSVTFFLKLAITCKNLVLSLVVVHLVIFYIVGHKNAICKCLEHINIIY